MSLMAYSQHAVFGSSALTRTEPMWVVEHVRGFLVQRRRVVGTDNKGEETCKLRSVLMFSNPRHVSVQISRKCKQERQWYTSEVRIS